MGLEYIAANYSVEQLLYPSLDTHLKYSLGLSKFDVNILGHKCLTLPEGR